MSFDFGPLACSIVVPHGVLDVLGGLDRIGAVRHGDPGLSVLLALRRRKGPLLHYAALHNLEGRVGQAGQVDERNLLWVGGVAGEARLLVGPALHVAAALGEAGVEAFSDFPPFVVVDDFGRRRRCR